MNRALRSLIERYRPETVRDWENALKEIVQELGAVDFEQAQEDVRPFIRDAGELALWDSVFFGSLVDRLTSVPVA